MTKLHESWHRGWLSDLTQEGPFPALPTAASSLFWYLTKNGWLTTVPPPKTRTGRVVWRVSRDPDVSRREAINRVAAAFSLSNKAVYAIVERLKVSGK